MRNIFLLLALLLVALTAVNCGGGGGSQSVSLLREDTFTVAPDEAISKTFGDVTITATAGVYPNGATITLKQYNVAPFKPGNPNFKPMHPALELSASESANSELTISVPSDPDGYIVGMLQEDSWIALRTSVDNDRISFALPNTPGLRPGSGGLFTLWKLVIGIAGLDKHDSTLGIHLIDGTGEFGPGSALIVHGLFDDHLSVKGMAKDLRAKFGWRNVYSVSYQWWDTTPEVASYVASILDDPSLDPKSITMVGHSRGCIVIRYALEKLQKTRPVKEAIFFCGPNEGSFAASIADLVFYLFTGWLNGEFSASPLRLLRLDDPFLSELILGSQFLDELNSYDMEQRGKVDYLLVGGSKDWVVPVASATAIDIDMQELTGGSVSRYTIEGAGHGTMKTNPIYMDLFYNLVGPVSNSLEVSATPNPVDGQNDGWHYTIKVKNVSTSPITLDSLTIDMFRKDGQWYGVQWCDPTTPGGELFPYRYFYWGRVLQPGETVQINTWWWTNNDHDPLSSIPLLYQARTAVLTVQAVQEPGHQIANATTTLVAHYSDVWPEDPSTRRPTYLPSQEGKYGSMGSDR